ncbi:hypothetical protein NX02_07510 [Sphingomonas sanxanigenens DSM 19645 = NX02]|uniref:Uncharacterized protein n=1 Tax=Sphingomonas sanxanigenens DSM 19645 = NX02 TaxID=1123269 RepID=W0A9S2_9SPHN|nr:hypothetical protein NX02_07510 [Sphingomonas sanxanigenens DSM 19645 = NX02]
MQRGAIGVLFAQSQDRLVLSAVVLALALASTEPSSAVEDAAPPTISSQEVAGCGVAPGRVAIGFDKDLDEEAIQIAKGSDPLNDKVLTCLAEASVRSDMLVLFEDAALETRYRDIYWPMVQQRQHDMAVRWLTEHDLIKGLPQPAEGRPLDDYARAVESHCGIGLGTMLKAQGTDVVTLDPAAMTDPAIGGRVECVMHVVAAATPPGAVMLGFTGNGVGGPAEPLER